jgi:hypothetical protein
MLVCPSFVSSAQVNEYGDENNDGVLQQRKSTRPWDVCVRHFLFLLYLHAAHSEVFWGI